VHIQTDLIAILLFYQNAFLLEGQSGDGTLTLVVLLEKLGFCGAGRTTSVGWDGRERCSRLGDAACADCRAFGKVLGGVACAF
jgi:hypothetical protein